MDANVFYLGGPAMMSHIQRHRRWFPGGWCTFENFACHIYYPWFGEYLLNEYYTLLPASEAVRLSQKLFECFSTNGEVFARPAVGRKLFAGQTFGHESLRNTLKGCPDPQSLIVIAKPKQIDREWRFYIAKNRICTQSQYASNGIKEISVNCPTHVVEFVESILKSTFWRPDPVFSMDVCESAGQIRLLELNGFSCSNLYACDLNAIVETVVAIARQD